MKIKLILTHLAFALSLTAEAQVSDFLAQLESRFQQHIDKFPRVQVKAIFNQNQYAPGDTVFFSVQYLFGNDTQVTGQDILHLNVVSDESEIVHRIRFKIKDGFAYNQFQLPEDLDAGIYRFYIYSDWMKNFGTETFYQESFAITKSNRINWSPPKSSELVAVPEGGKLTNGVANYVYISGNPDERIVLKNQNNEVLDSTRLNSTGVGNFRFVPAPNTPYQVSGAGNRTVVLKGIDTGVGLHVTTTNNDWTVELSLPTNSAWSTKNLYWVLVANDKLIGKKKVKFDVNRYTATLPTLSDSQVIHYLYLLTDSGEEVSQRIFVPSVDNPAVKVNMRLQPRVKQRQSYTFGMDVSDENNLRIPAYLAVAVNQKQLFEEEKHVPMYLQRVGSAFRWAKNYAGEYTRYLNEYLGTQSSQRFDWRLIVNNEPLPVQFKFRSEIIVRGKLVPQNGEKAAPDSTRVIAFLQKNVIGYETVAIKGVFALPLSFDFWDQDDIFMTLRYREKNLDSEYAIKILDDTSRFVRQGVGNVSEQPDAYSSYQKKRDLINRSYSYFGRSMTANESQKSTNYLFEEEFPPVDNAVKLADYIVFPTMDDLLKEVVTFVQLKRRNDEATVRLFYRYEKSVIFYKQDPLYIIDGVMTSDTEYFLNLKPESLLTVKAINNPNKLAQLGPLGQAGVIFVESKSGNLGERLKSKLFSITGLSKPIELTDARWIKENPPSIPDLRATLYWRPLTKSAAGAFESTFITSDDLGQMRIRVHGFTENGKELFAESYFMVEPNPNRN